MVQIVRRERGYRLTCDLEIPRPRAVVFEFFSNAYNLQQITPKSLHFEILTPAPILMKRGTLIDYRIRIRGVPVRWRTKIAAWEPGRGFVDEQLRGPYRRWSHEHRFEDSPAGTRMMDTVDYSVLGGPLVHALFVKRDLERIFRYRIERLQEILPALDSKAA